MPLSCQSLADSRQLQNTAVTARRQAAAGSIMTPVNIVLPLSMGEDHSGVTTATAIEAFHSVLRASYRMHATLCCRTQNNG